jgi:hypothetical protein
VFNAVKELLLGEGKLVRSGFSVDLNIHPEGSDHVLVSKVHEQMQSSYLLSDDAHLGVITSVRPAIEQIRSISRVLLATGTGRDLDDWLQVNLEVQRDILRAPGGVPLFCFNLT